MPKRMMAEMRPSANLPAAARAAAAAAAAVAAAAAGRK